QDYVLRVRQLACRVCECYFAGRAEAGFPLADAPMRQAALEQWRQSAAAAPA
ncbi:MAG: glycine--tRNA ligase subunit alpha, partial [Gammaproteobacteria bacterium AqS3]|nr:glycine--tRNA ligase subunit alpha [Gammaproteobacteria bacterium AqS3]